MTKTINFSLSILVLGGFRERFTSLQAGHKCLEVSTLFGVTLG